MFRLRKFESDKKDNNFPKRRSAVSLANDTTHGYRGTILLAWPALTVEQDVFLSAITSIYSSWIPVSRHRVKNCVGPTHILSIRSSLSEM